jgi:predicted acyl esterase
MNLMSHLMQRQLRLDPPLTRDLIAQRDLRVPMPDGVVLLADRWAPRVGGDGLPVALIRTPYGRGAMLSAGMIRPLAERGFQVILQSARGTFGSGATVAAERPGSRPSESGRSRCAAISSGWCGASSGHAATISSQRIR